MGRTLSRGFAHGTLLGALVVCACDPFGDLESSLELVNPTKTRFKVPGRKLTSGTFDDFSVILKEDGALTLLARRSSGARERAHIASFSPEDTTSGGCETAEFSRILGEIPYRGLLAVFDDSDGDLSGDVDFVNEECEVLQSHESVRLATPKAGVEIPSWTTVLREMDESLTVMTPDRLENLPDSSGGEIVGATSKYLWIKTATKIMRFSNDDLRREVSLAEEASETYAGDSSSDLVFRRKSGEFVYVTPSGALVTLGSTLCNPLLAGGTVLSLDPCASGKLRYDRIRENENGSIETLSYHGSAIEGRLVDRRASDGTSFLFLTNAEISDEAGHVYRARPREDGSILVDEMTSRGLLTSNPDLYLADAKKGAGDLRSSATTLLAEQALPTLNASGTCALLVRARFDGSYGDGLCFPGGADYGEPRVFGRKILSDENGQWLSFGVEDQILFVSDENDAGTLHRLVKTNSRENDEILARDVLVGSIEPISAPAGVVFLRKRGDSHELVASLDYSGLTQRIHDRVGRYIATAHSDSLAQGIFYLVRDGEDAGIWYAKAE